MDENKALEKWQKAIHAAEALNAALIGLNPEPTYERPEPPPPPPPKVRAVPREWVEVVQALVAEIERNTCTHEETHRGGFIWEICNQCGAKWADDEGGKPEFKWSEAAERARELIQR